MSTSDDVEATLPRETRGKHVSAAVGNRTAQVCVGPRRCRTWVLADAQCWHRGDPAHLLPGDRWGQLQLPDSLDAPCDLRTCDLRSSGTCWGTEVVCTALPEPLKAWDPFGHSFIPCFPLFPPSCFPSLYFLLTLYLPDMLLPKFT